MALEVKICGLSTPESLDAAVAGGAAFVGFVFYPRSPRAVTLEQAAALAARVPERVQRVGLVVDAEDAFLAELTARVPLELLQLHGRETPERAAAIRARSGKAVMKVIHLAEAADLEAVPGYLPVVDRLMFEAKPPASLKNALPGGNAVAFDWSLLTGRSFPRPWMLAGGLTAANLKEAAATSGARRVDVSSGVESAPGVKDLGRIAAFLETARSL